MAQKDVYGLYSRRLTVQELLEELLEKKGGELILRTQETPAELWTVVDDSTANTAKTISKAAEADKAHYITGFEAVIQGADTTQDVIVELKDGATVKWRTVIGSGAKRGERVGFVNPHGVKMSVNTQTDLTVGAGGTGVIITLNLAGYTI